MLRHAAEDLRVLHLHRNPGIQVVLGSSMLMIMGTSLVYPVLPVIADSLGIADAHVGLVLTAFTLPAIFLAPLAGFIADLRGRRMVLVAGLLLYGGAGLAIAWVETLPWLLAMRALQGIGYSGIMPLVIVLIGDLYSKEQETSAQGVKVVLDRATLLALPAIAGFLAAIAWQAPFLLYATAIPLAFAAFRWLPDRPTTARGRTPAYARRVFRASMQVRSMTIFSVGSLRFFLEMAFFVYVPLFALDRLGMTVSSGGLLFSVFAIGSIVTAGTIGRLVARFDRFALVVAAFLLQAAALGAGAMAHSAWVLAAAMLAFGLANGVISPVQKSLLTQSVPWELRGGFVSADRIAQNLAKSVAPLVAGALVAAFSIPVMFLVMAAISAAWAVGMLVLLMMGWLQSTGTADPRPTAASA